MADQSHFDHHVECRHTDLARLFVECHKETFHHYDRPVDNNTEVDRPHRKQVGTHAHCPQADKGK